MPTLRSQYQHVRNDISKESYVSPSKSLVNLTSSSGSDEDPAAVAASAGHCHSAAVNNIVSPGSGRKGYRSRRSSRTSTSSRKSSQGSSRRSSGSLSEDILNTATVLSTSTTNEPPLYTTTSMPTLITQSGGLAFNNSFASYKHMAENAIMQSLQVSQKLSVDPLPHVYTTEDNFVYLDQQMLHRQPYIPLLMKTRLDHLHQDPAITSQQRVGESVLPGNDKTETATLSADFRHEETNGIRGGDMRRQDAAGRKKSDLMYMEANNGNRNLEANTRNIEAIRSKDGNMFRANELAYSNRYDQDLAGAGSRSRLEVQISGNTKPHNQLSGGKMDVSPEIRIEKSSSVCGSMDTKVEAGGGLVASSSMTSSLKVEGGGLVASSSMTSLVSDTKEDCEDEGLRLILEKNDCFETQEGLRKRSGIVKSLDTLVKQWVRSCGLERGLDYTILESNQGKVLTYGSCKLEANDQDADMDLICIAPNFVERDDFFNKLFLSLKKQPCVKELRRLPEVFVPVMKFKFDNIEIDFTFSQLELEVPENEEDLLDEKYTHNLSDRCLRSLNGYRATCQILTLVPNVKVFQLALCAIKLWGRINGVYGNILGYLGGASWAILVAKACQELGRRSCEQNVADVVFLFFQMFSQWRWPNPVFIRQVAEQPPGAWNPQINTQDREHCMPIITSSVPQMNSAVNISKSVQRYIQDRMREAHHICLQIQSGAKGWDHLFKPFLFYREYDTFIKICGSCEQESSYWFGCLESKLRHFKEKIEMSPKIQSVRIWPKGYIRAAGEGSSWTSQTWFIGFVGCGSQVDHMLHEDFVTLKERCYSDLKKNFGQSNLVHRAFNVNMQIIQRSDIFKFLSLKELNMNSMEGKTRTYSTSSQDINGQAPSSPTVRTSVPGANPGAGHPGVAAHSFGQPLPGVGQNLATLTGSVYSHNVLTTLLAQHQHPQCSVSTSAGPANLNFSSQQQMFALQNVYPYYSLGHLYPPPDMSPPILPHKGRQNSPRPCSSPKNIPGARNQSPSIPLRQHTNSPSHFIYPEGITAVGHHYSNSPKIYPTPAPYSPKHQVSTGGTEAPPIQPIGPFPFPPPLHSQPVVTTPPTLVSAGAGTAGRGGESPPPPKLSTYRNIPGIQKRDRGTTLVTGVTTINNNLKAQAICSCQSISDVENEQKKQAAAANVKKNKEREKVSSGNEDERLRSISNSSDSVPPRSLYRSRINHQDSLPPSPHPATSSNQKHNKDHVPLEQADVSVPPPVKVTESDSLLNQSDSDAVSSFLTFSSLNSAEKTVKRRAPRSPRLSVSELQDAPSPVPVQVNHRANIMVNLYHSGGDDVFTK